MTARNISVIRVNHYHLNATHGEMLVEQGVSLIERIADGEERARAVNQLATVGRYWATADDLYMLCR
jgi:hypothetical protein